MSGELEFKYFNLLNADQLKKDIGIGDVIDIPVGCPHKITAKTDSIIVEVSTHHENSDSYRIEKGDSQWKEKKKY